MIEGFEEFTQDIKDSEIETINLVARGFNARIGKEKAITNTALRALMYENTRISISDAKLRRYVQYIRVFNLCPMLCSGQKGYWIAKDSEEYIQYREAFASRVRSMEFTRSCMFHFDMENNVIN